MRPQAIRPLPGQESVWDYPRPAVVEPTLKRLQVVHNGTCIAETVAGFRVLETSHPPTYYFPPQDVHLEALEPSERRTRCEFKGIATWFDLVMDTQTLSSVAWSYPRPTRAFSPITGFISFFAGPMDRCTVDGEIVTPQAGSYYGGWITSDIVGPFKGAPGTWGW